MSYLDDRQAILNYCKTIDGLADKIKGLGGDITNLTTAVGVAIHFNANYLPLYNFDYWDPYYIELKVTLKNRPNAANIIATLCTTDSSAIDVNKASTTAQGLLSSMKGWVDASYITTNTLLYLCLSFPLDESIDFSSIIVRDADYNTVPSSFYTIEEIGFSPSASPLATPTNLSATNITSSGATVSWTGDENATDYKVEYRRQGDTTWNE